MKHANDEEIDANYDFFRRHLADFLETQAGRVAVIRKREIIGFFATVDEADSVASQQFSDGVYSLQPVVAEPVDLGFFSHAGG